MSKIIFLACAIVYMVHYGESHSYHLGGCPDIDPQPNFDMRKMLGLWYVMQKTSTGSYCITYNFTKTDEPGEYKLEQVSQHFALGLTPWKHQYRYTGILKVPDSGVPARMQVRFPLSVAGSAKYTVFLTDYETYAGLFTCQKLGFAHRRSATILSRERTLDKMYLDKIRSRLSQANIDPYELSIINQQGCPRGENGTNIKIDDDTVSTRTVANVFRKAGEKIGDGVEYIAGAAQTAYHKVADSDETSTNRGSRANTANPESEWLP